MIYRFPVQKGMVPPPENRDQLLVMLRKLECGEHRAGLVRATASKLAEFHNKLTDDHFRRAAEVMKSIAFSPDNSPRTKIRAVEAAMRPVSDCVKILPRLLKSGNNVSVQNMSQRITAYLDAWEEGDFGELAQVLIDAYSSYETENWDRIRAISATIGCAIKTLDILLEIEQQAKMLTPQAEDDTTVTDMLADLDMDEMIAAAERRQKHALEVGQAEEVGPHSAGDEGAGRGGGGEGVGQGQQEDAARQEEVSQVEEVKRG